MREKDVAQSDLVMELDDRETVYSRRNTPLNTAEHKIRGNVKYMRFVISSPGKDLI